MIAEVEGGFSNPIAVIAVMAWAFFPSLAAGWAAWSVEPNRLGLWRWLLAALLFVLTPVARQVIGTFLYAIENPQIISVGFWGGAVLLACPLGPMILVATSTLLFKRLRHRPA